MSTTHFQNSSTGTIKLAQDLAKLVNNRQGSDVQFKVGGGATDRNVKSNGETIIDNSAVVTMYAHSAILSCRSQHFAAMFQNEVEWKERSGGVIDIPDISPIIFENILEYIYTGNVNVKPEHLVGLITTAEGMEIGELSIKCQDMAMDVLKKAFSDKEENENNKTKNNFETQLLQLFEQQPHTVVVAVQEILIPLLKLAHRLNLRDLFQRLSDWTNVHMEFILASPDVQTLFTKNLPTQIFAQIVLQEPMEIYYKLNESLIPPSLKTDIVFVCQQLSETGDISALYRLGLCWQYGFGVKKVDFKAVEYFTKAVDAGNTDAQYSLGSCYYKGHGVTQDYAEAIRLYTKAAEAGNTNAQNALGVCYKCGYGVTQDYIKAVELFTKAAEAGNMNAQNNLGVCYEDGHGVTQDYTKAIELYTKAAESGSTDAQNNLGLCYANGYGVSKNYNKAIELYTKAAEAVNAPAQNNLAGCYENGTGVTKDYVKAIQFYTKAAENGSIKAQKSLMRLNDPSAQFNIVDGIKNVKRFIGL